MMKTLCVAVVVLGLASVCQSASLACEKLVKPLDKGPEASGIWYLIAASTDSCLVTTLVNAFFSFSVRMDVTPKDALNVYDTNVKVKVYGRCGNESTDLYYENNSIFGIDSNNQPSGKPAVLLYSGCPDCIVVKGEDESLSILMLFSRRQNVSDAELKEFEAQSECLSWSKPLVPDSDHNHDNCPLHDDIDASGTWKMEDQFYQRLKTKIKDIFVCFSKDLIDSIVSEVNEWLLW